MGPIAMPQNKQCFPKLSGDTVGDTKECDFDENLITSCLLYFETALFKSEFMRAQSLMTLQINLASTSPK